LRVFISWSKEPSRSIARELAGLLDDLLDVEPWMSDEEIASGRRWRDEVGSALSETDFGIICLTAANQHEPWLMFEAGALAKNLIFGRVIPLYIDLGPTDVTGPLSDYQGRPLDKDGMRRVVEDINVATERPKAAYRLANLFKLTWPPFERTVTEAKTRTPQSAQPKRTSEDMLEELVERVRAMEGGRPPRRVTLNPGDTLSIGGARPFSVPNDPEVIRFIQDLLAMRDEAEIWLNVPPALRTAQTRVSLWSEPVTATTLSAPDETDEPPEPTDLEEPPEGCGKPD
jgi:TIR domain